MHGEGKVICTYKYIQFWSDALLLETGPHLKTFNLLKICIVSDIYLGMPRWGSADIRPELSIMTGAVEGLLICLAGCTAEEVELVMEESGS